MSLLSRRPRRTISALLAQIGKQTVVLENYPRFRIGESLLPLNLCSIPP